MIDYFLFIMITVVICFLGGVIFLIWFPFKKRLIKSGKLSQKLNRRINWSFSLTVCAAIFISYSFRNYRTPSQDRLENISDITLPDKFITIKDEYQDMWQDYCINYELEFDKESTQELIANIKASHFYNSTLVESGSWIKSQDGYNFTYNDDRTFFSIQVNTLTNILTYSECGD